MNALELNYDVEYGNKLIADFMGKRYDYLICDNCGKADPVLLNPGNSRLTECCSTYDQEHENCFYSTTDKNGNKVYSIGKTLTPFNSTPKDLKYNSSWDWLIPVVVFLEEKNVNIGIRYHNTKIEWYDSNDSYETKSGVKSETKIHSLWCAIVHFLEWIRDCEVDLDNPAYDD